ncbi:MAG: hypothetical protein AAF960_29100 [Bacteroidota bacterium]
MLPSSYQQLTSELLDTLEDFNYALLTPSLLSAKLPVLKIALRSRERGVFLRRLANKITYQLVQSKLDSTILTVDLEKGQFVTIELYHYFHIDRLTYLDAAAVLEQKRKSSKNYYLPKLEHLLEFRVINSFLNGEGLSDRIIKHFDDLHILLQEGLLDYFNTKYDTYFSSLYELAEYKETVANHFRKQLKQFPANRLANRMRLRWVNLKRFLKRSAVYSY